MENNENAKGGFDLQRFFGLDYDPKDSHNRDLFGVFNAVSTGVGGLFASLIRIVSPDTNTANAVFKDLKTEVGGHESHIGTRLRNIYSTQPSGDETQQSLDFQGLSFNKGSIIKTSQSGSRMTPAEALQLVAASFVMGDEMRNTPLPLHIYNSDNTIRPISDYTVDDQYNISLLHKACVNAGINVQNEAEVQVAMHRMRFRDRPRTEADKAWMKFLVDNTDSPEYERAKNSLLSLNRDIPKPLTKAFGANALELTPEEIKKEQEEAEAKAKAEAALNTDAESAEDKSAIEDAEIISETKADAATDVDATPETKAEAEAKETAPKPEIQSFSKDTLNLIVGEMAASTGLITQERVEQVAQIQADMIAVSKTLQEQGLVYKDEKGAVKYNIEALKELGLLNRFGDAANVFELAFMPEEKRAELKEKLGVSTKNQKIAEGYQLAGIGNFNDQLGLLVKVEGMATLLKAANPSHKIFTTEFDKHKEDLYSDLTAIQSWNRAGDALVRIAEGKVDENAATTAKNIVTGNVAKFLAGDLKKPDAEQHDELTRYQCIHVATALHEMRVAKGLDSFTEEFMAELPPETKVHLERIFLHSEKGINDKYLAQNLNRVASLDKLQHAILNATDVLDTFLDDRYESIERFDNQGFGYNMLVAAEQFSKALRKPAAPSHAQNKTNEGAIPAPDMG